MRIRASAFTGLCLLLALSTGCSDDGERASAPDTPIAAPSEVASPTTADPKGVAAAAALRAYRGMWQDMVVAARTSDHKSPLLARHATGAALRQLVSSLYADQQQGLVTKGRPLLRPRVGESDVEARPQRVVVEDCADSRNWLRYSRSTGKVADTPGGNRHISADVRGTADQWKVVDFRVREVGSC